MSAYSLSAIVILGLQVQTQEILVRLHAAALFLMAIGLGIVLSIHGFGNLVAWTGRASQFAASLYFMAAVVVYRRSGAPVDLRAWSGGMLRMSFAAARNGCVLPPRRQGSASTRTTLKWAIPTTQPNSWICSACRLAEHWSWTGALLQMPCTRRTAPHSWPHADAANCARGERQFDSLPTLDLEYRIVRKDGSLRWLKVRGRTVFRGSGAEERPFRASGIVQDITERKDSEEALQDSELMYRTFISDSLQGFAIIQDGRLVLCNDALCKLSGFSLEEAREMSSSDVFGTIHPEDRARVAEAMARIAADGIAAPAQAIRLLRKDDETRWVEVLGARTTFHGRSALQISYVDRTEEMRAEDAYRALIDHAPYGMAILQNGRTIFANNALVELSGYSAQELLSFSPEQVVDLVHEDDRARVVSEMSARLAGVSAPQKQTFRFLRKGGIVRWVETQSVRTDHHGAPALQLTYKDVNAEKMSEIQLDAAHQKMRNLATHLLQVREDERMRVAREIHDELGQTLAALKMDLHWLAKRIGGEIGPLRTKVKGTIELGEQAIKTVQRIASDLRPKMLDDLGLVPALGWLCADFSRQTKISCTMEGTIPTGKTGVDAATTLYRIAQEALSNVRLHSHADNAVLRLYASKAEILLHVEDDGVGITDEQSSAPDAYGLIGMRERAQGQGGSLSITGESGFGTILIARIPLSSEGGAA